MPKTLLRKSTAARTTTTMLIAPVASHGHASPVMASPTSQPTADQATEQYAEAVAMRVAGITHLRLGEGHAALTALAIARDMFAHQGHDAQVAWTMQGEGQVLDMIDRSHEASQRLEEAETIFRRLDDLRGAGHLQRCRADILRRTGHLDEAMVLYGTALDLCHHVNDADGLARILSARAELHLIRQTPDQALVDLTRALALRATSPRRPDAIDFLTQARLARCAIALGKADDAFAHITEAQAIANTLALNNDRSDPDVTAHLKSLPKV